MNSIIVLCNFAIELDQHSKCSDQDLGWIVWSLIPGRCMRLQASQKCSDWLWSPLSLLFSGQRGVLSLGVKWLGLEADHSLQLVVKEWSCTIAPTLCLHGVHRDNFAIFTFYKMSLHASRIFSLYRYFEYYVLTFSTWQCFQRETQEAVLEYCTFNELSTQSSPQLLL